MIEMIPDRLERNTIGILFSGGGARGAYQAGCVRAMAEILGEEVLPFGIITGVSAGAINGAYLASNPLNFSAAAEELAGFWEHLEFSSVISTRPPILTKIAAEWISDLSFGAFKSQTRIKSLVSTAPLVELLREKLPIEQVNHFVKEGVIRAFAVTATDYQTSQNITFVQSPYTNCGWSRQNRQSEFTDIRLEHVLASSAIPILFPPVAIGDRYFGDGMLRNMAPLSPAIHLGARHLVVIGVRAQYPDQLAKTVRPTAARVMSVMINSALLDSIDADFERLNRYNELAEMTDALGLSSPLSYIRHLYLRPSQDIASIAMKYADALPVTFRYLLQGLGSAEESGELISYLLFSPEYCRALLDLGYQDTLARHEEVSAFFHGARQHPEGSLAIPLEDLNVLK